MATGALTQWGHINPGSTMETYLLKEGPRCESPWDAQMVCGYQPSSYSTDTEGSMAGWYENTPDGRLGAPTEMEVPVEGAPRNPDDEDESWMCRMASIKTNQFTLQRHIKEV
ncbi:UNVERIFIED_CONTAM: hypothetical protein K2H54_058317, partial [Gekko kuhli]